MKTKHNLARILGRGAALALVTAPVLLHAQVININITADESTRFAGSFYCEFDSSKTITPDAAIVFLTYLDFKGPHTGHAGVIPGRIYTSGGLLLDLEGSGRYSIPSDDESISRGDVTWSLTQVVNNGSVFSGNFEFQFTSPSVPEPASVGVVAGVALGGFAFLRRRLK